VGSAAGKSNLQNIVVDAPAHNQQNGRHRQRSSVTSVNESLLRTSTQTSAASLSAASVLELGEAGADGAEADMGDSGPGDGDRDAGRGGLGVWPTGCSRTVASVVAMAYPTALYIMTVERQPTCSLTPPAK
jgi:hypothetical protein